MNNEGNLDDTLSMAHATLTLHGSKHCLIQKSRYSSSFPNDDCNPIVQWGLYTSKSPLILDALCRETMLLLW